MTDTRPSLMRAIRLGSTYQPKHALPRDPPPLLSLVALGWALVVALLVLAILVRWTTVDHPAAAMLSLACCAVAGSPLALAYHDRDAAELADPVVFAAWAFWLPMFGVGGVALALGWNRPYYLAFVDDPGDSLAAAEAWAIAAFVAFAAGASIPVLHRWGATLARRLPRGGWAPGASALGAWCLIVGGLAVSTWGLVTGRLGYDATTAKAVSPVPAYLQTVTLLGAALLWFDLIRTPRPWGPKQWSTFGGLALVAIVASGLAESRAALITWILAVILTTALVRTPVSWRVVGGLALAAFVSLAVGALLVSSYRELRFDRATASARASEPSSRLDDLRDAVGNIGDRGLGDNLEYAQDRIVQRLEAPAALAVIIGRRGELRDQERDDGAPRVLESVAGAFVPRAAWPTKPATSDPVVVSRLYFEYEDNAFGFTPMGDLLRDLGPLAVPLGMLVMGAVFRLLHAVLVGSGEPTAGRVAAFVVLLAKAPSWWEGFYANYLADLIRVGGIVVVALAFVAWTAHLRRGTRYSGAVA